MMLLLPFRPFRSVSVSSSSFRSACLRCRRWSPVDDDELRLHTTYTSATSTAATTISPNAAFPGTDGGAGPDPEEEDGDDSLSAPPDAEGEVVPLAVGGDGGGSSAGDGADGGSFVPPPSAPSFSFLEEGDADGLGLWLGYHVTLGRHVWLGYHVTVGR
jgi:hypothetical protein